MNVLKKQLKNGYIGIDNTYNGKCSKCGECCGIILPLDQEDADKIVEYVSKNNIFPQKQKLVMERKLQCPYYTGNKAKGCAIYEARPKICKLYQCNQMPKISEMKELKNAIPVDMWGFALDIEKEMKRCN